MSDTTELEQQLAQTKELVARRALALRLAQNHEFRKLIMENYMITETVRCATEAGDPNMDPAARADCLAMAQAGGHLRRFLNAIDQMGKVAERDLPALEDALVEARNESEDQD